MYTVREVKLVFLIAVLMTCQLMGSREGCP